MHVEPGMEVIPRSRCLKLLESKRVGRLAFVADGGQPIVLPVNYAVAADIVLFRTGVGTKLEAALGAKVAFQVDDIDVERASGWSVLVQGVAEEITDDPGGFAAILRESLAPTWVPGPADHSVRIVPRLISGRRLPGPQR